MSAPAAIAGQLVDAKNIAVHKTVRLSIDVPAEMGEAIIKAFGWPSMAAPVPVAVARMTAAPQIEAAAEPATAPDEPRRWSNLKKAQQAGIRCSEIAFQLFLREQGQPQVTDDKTAAEYVRMVCGNLHSRAELDTRASAGRLWNDLDTRFRAWMVAA